MHVQVDAQFILVMYATGEVVQQDDVEAYLWSNLAASRSTGEVRETAVRNRDLAASELTPDALNEAQRLARGWDAAHPREPCLWIYTALSIDEALRAFAPYFP